MGSWTKRAASGRLAIAVAIVVSVATLVMPALASAADPYHLSIFDCGGRRGSGQTDAAGNLYVTCLYRNGVNRPRVAVYDPAGNLLRSIDLPYYATDVAPSPDAAYLYVVRDSDKQVHRWVRQATGAYVEDGWKLDQYPQWGADYTPLGEFISIDGAGNLYVSSGTWTTAPASIVEYSPAGHLITQFGAWENSWATGIFYWMNAGVAVTKDGKHVYVAEVGNNRVQRFDRGADGTFSYAAKVGNDPATDDDPRTGICGDTVRAGRLSAPYDVGVDDAGNLYVLNTTCRQVKKFAYDGTLLLSEQLPNPYNDYIHGMAVDGAGDVYLPEVDRIMRLGADPQPDPNPQGGQADTPVWITDAYSGAARAFAKAPDTTVPAWKWSATGWTFTTLASNTLLQVQPFSAGWMWANVGGTWYAMHTSDIAKPAAQPDPQPQPQPTWIDDAFRGTAALTGHNGEATLTVWKWSAAGWQQTELASGTTFQVQPFSAGWMWGNRGVDWYAVHTADLAKG